VNFSNPRERDIQSNRKVTQNVEKRHKGLWVCLAKILVYKKYFQVIN
jgi:hypothetical protein